MRVEAGSGLMVHHWTAVADGMTAVGGGVVADADLEKVSIAVTGACSARDIAQWPQRLVRTWVVRALAGGVPWTKAAARPWLLRQQLRPAVSTCDAEEEIARMYLQSKNAWTLLQTKVLQLDERRCSSTGVSHCVGLTMTAALPLSVSVSAAAYTSLLWPRPPACVTPPLHS